VQTLADASVHEPGWAALLAMLVGGSVARWEETLTTVAPVVASVQIAS
jgi:hypothetical protein